MSAAVSLNRLAANRANAQKSTGPRTEEGKAVSRRNALRHGLTARTVVLELEDPEEFEQFRNRILEAFAPAEGSERLLTDELAGALWRLKRAQRIEAAAFDHHLDTLKHQVFPDDAAARNALASDIGLGIVISDESAEPFCKLFRYVGAAERYYLRLQAQLLKLQAERRRHGFVSSTAESPVKLETPRLRTVQFRQVAPQNGCGVRPVHPDSLEDGALLPENALHPAARKERGVGSE